MVYCVIIESCQRRGEKRARKVSNRCSVCWRSRIDSHPKVDKPIHLRSRLIKIKLRRSSIIGRRSIRAAISKLVLDVVFFSFHPSFATTRPSNLPFIRSLCLRWTGNGNIVEISNPLRASPSIHREFTGEKCSKKVFADRRVFFRSFLFPLSGLSLHSLSFKVKVFAYSSKKITIFDYGDFFKEKLMNSFGVNDKKNWGVKFKGLGIRI